MLTTILGLFGSPVMSGLFGFISAHFAKKEERKLLELKYKNTLDMATLNAANRREELSLQGDLAEKTLEGEAFVASQKYGNQKSGNKIFDGIKSMVRPLITTYLLAAVTYFAYNVHQIINGLDAIPVNELIIMYKEIIISLLSLTNLAVAYWFGSRGTSRKGEE